MKDTTKRTMKASAYFVLAVLIAIGWTYAQQANHTSSIPIKSSNETGYAEMAKIPLTAAVNAALKEVPGIALRAELENENGYLVYGVEVVKTDNVITDVKIDAGNGKILKIETDQKDQENHEGEDSDNGRETSG
jgi:uncharacterized membrane protein YkoI